MRIVMVFGAFDGLHPGHLNFFKQAKRFGNTLIVSIGTDKNVKKIKSRKPLFSQEERLELVKHCDLVDKAIIGAQQNFYNHIKTYSPDVICLGYDQWAKEEEVRRELDKVGLVKTKVIRLKPFKEKRAKSTIFKSRSVDF